MCKGRVEAPRRRSTHPFGDRGGPRGGPRRPSKLVEISSSFEELGEICRVDRELDLTFADSFHSGKLN